MQLFRIACVVLLTTSASHLAWHIYLTPRFQLSTQDEVIPSNPQEKEVLKMMNDYQREIAGGQMSFMDVQLGLSLLYSILLGWVGTVNLMLIKPLQLQLKLLAKISWLNATFLGIASIVALIYFFWLPVVCLAGAALLYGVAGLQLARTHSASQSA